MKPLSSRKIKEFQETIWDYYQKHGRDLPWRNTRDPWKIFVSEIMLQQTQVKRVALFYQRFIREFPDAKSLSRAPLQKVLQLWQGLGYNRRALNLRRAAVLLCLKFGGILPNTEEELVSLPGVGNYTASAVRAFAFNKPSVFVETNIRTVYLHFFFKRRGKVRDREVVALLEATLPRNVNNTPPFASAGGLREWYFALMDFGAHLKETSGNANKRSAHYAKQSRFKGSRRELRGEILRRAAQNRFVSEREFVSKENKWPVPQVLSSLVAEGFLEKTSRGFRLMQN